MEGEETDDGGWAAKNCKPRNGGGDSTATARELRRRPGLAGAVIVATTGYGRGADVRRSLDEGFAAHLTKPYDPAELRRLLEGIAVTPAPHRPGGTP